MELCLAALHKEMGRNMNGTDFIPRLAVVFAGRKTALFGTAEPWTSRAAVALERIDARLCRSWMGSGPTRTTQRQLPAPCRPSSFWQWAVQGRKWSQRGLPPL